MRVLAIVANLALLGIIGLMMARGDFVIDADYMLPALLMITTPVLSLVALLLRGAGANDWLSRYFERMAIQERRKLETLRPRTGQPGAAPNGGPAASVDNSNAPGGPPSVS
jgi:hypothetical protein